MQRCPLHSDPAHTMLAVSNAQGNSQGHLWYDPHGSVLTGTLPTTLTEHIGRVKSNDNVTGASALLSSICE